jgi:membrane fusion protein (multidrug efflux system)
VTRDLKGTPTALVVGPDNKVELRQLKASRTVGSQWLIEDGLKAGDRVITEGLQFVKPGVRSQSRPKPPTSARRTRPPHRQLTKPPAAKGSNPCQNFSSTVRFSPG